MIIGISGKKEHGKSTVAIIIQYLLLKDQLSKQVGGKRAIPMYLSNLSLKDVMEWDHVKRYEHTGWAERAFGDRLKGIVCLILGCSRKQLEDRTFKETPLGEEWNAMQVQPSLGNISGNILGKISRRILTIEEWKQLGMLEKSYYRETYLTPRKLLQLLGTQFGRNIVHPNIWINALMKDYVRTSMATFEGGKVEFAYCGPEWDGNNEGAFTYPDWIIPDVRMLNELEAVRQRGGIIVRVNRPSIINNDEHESETALDDYRNFDAIITNDGDLENHLVEEVREVLKRFKLIS